MWMTFFTAYYDVDDYLVTNHRQIGYNYIGGWLFIDILGIFPFEYIFDKNNG